ncbi:RNA polymerase sigma factor [Paenibacillus filicis]|uniref:RNA polymerase sigma factor n=1 Tax=Paenibacillus gyeongsangnamensis TaxID=3388067 RepID=A0ABT4QAX7_9BACL|nr:RNA polymerase sigma factor [Paenibacillus filicis]MCZ8514037.1 RNA polymerase sigma factor [Paenibacillus filicis]
MEDLLQRCKENMDAFGELYRLYSADVFRTAYLLVRNRSMAEDITQETFILLFSKIPLYTKNAGSFRNWLYSVTMNTTKNSLRKQLSQRSSVIAAFLVIYLTEHFSFLR